jgi:hypothetical protein
MREKVDVKATFSDEKRLENQVNLVENRLKKVDYFDQRSGSICHFNNYQTKKSNKSC